jgi:hypothetical protein
MNFKTDSKSAGTLLKLGLALLVLDQPHLLQAFLQRRLSRETKLPLQLARIPERRPNISLHYRCHYQAAIIL